MNDYESALTNLELAALNYSGAEHLLEIETASELLKKAAVKFSIAETARQVALTSHKNEN